LRSPTGRHSNAASEQAWFACLPCTSCRRAFEQLVTRPWWRRSATPARAVADHPRVRACARREERLGIRSLGRLLGVSAAEADRTADRLLERVGLLDRRDALPSELSGGQQQRVAICAALAHRPRLFIADEPTGELDASNATEIYELLRELAQDAGATTIVVSHDPESARVADRVVQIRDGRVSGESRGSGETEAVVNRGGWIRLPEELVGDAARAQLEPAPGGILVRVTERPAARDPAPQRPGRAGPRDRRLTKVHGQGATAITVFDRLSLGFTASRLSAVTGPSGSGKSTLLHLLAGLDLPTAGTSSSRHDALAARCDGSRRVAPHRIGIVTQGTDLVPFLTAQESVEFALALRGAAR
jgi:ABC-type lipoprotein export system ATPase subunit